MSTVDEIVRAIEHLSIEDRAELSRRLHGWNDDAWDEQISRDVGAGKFDKLIAKVKQEAKDGRLTELP